MLLKKTRSKVLVNVNHFKALCKRYFALLFSDKVSFFMLLFQAPIMTFIIDFACNKPFNGYLESEMTLFVIATVCVIMATLNSYREICKERDILIRETNAGLDSSAYVLSKVVVQGVICLFQALIIVLGTSLYFDFKITKVYSYINYYFFTFLILMAATCVGLFISAILKNSDSAILPVLFIIIAQVVLSEAIIQLPKNFEFLSYFAITRWALGGYGHIFNFQRFKDAGVPVSCAFNSTYATCVLVLIGICILCIILTIITVKRLRKKRF